DQRLQGSQRQDGDGEQPGRPVRPPAAIAAAPGALLADHRRDLRRESAGERERQLRRPAEPLGRHPGSRHGHQRRRRNRRRTGDRSADIHRGELMFRTVLAVASALALSACATVDAAGPIATATTRVAHIPQQPSTQMALRELPPPNSPVAVAVYSFVDQTGQYKPSDTGQTLSRAVSQGGASILVKALQDAGQRQWFTVVEREMLRNLLQERQIIREMRERYLGEAAPNPEALPSLLFAGVLLEGGVI